MSFDGKDYPNRKDHIRPYRRSARFNPSCRPGGRCGYCQSNRLHYRRKVEREATLQLREALR